MPEALDEIKIGGHGGQPAACRGQPVHPRQGATTSTMSCSPACCTWRSCVARSPTPASAQHRHVSKAWNMPGRPPGADRRDDGGSATWRGCPRCRTTRRPCWRPTRFVSKVKKCACRHRRRSIYRQGRRARRSSSSTSRCRSVINPLQSQGRRCAPIIRDDKEGQVDNTVLPLGGRRQADGTERAFARPTSSRKLSAALPAHAPLSAGVLRVGGRLQPATQKLTVYMTTQAPHIIRAAFALVTSCPST